MAKRQTQDNRIVIVCEDTLTAPNYLNDLCKHLGDIGSDLKLRVVPDIYDRNDVTEDAEPQEGKRQLKTGDKDKFQYYAQIDTKKNYDIYCAQPVRYVRECQLYMEREGFPEGWAVFDKDNINPAYASQAFQMASTMNGLHIAFTAYCIEEWFLAHFEYCTKAFENSECKDANGSYIGCNVNNGCHGDDCVIGYIRAKGYISDYEKTAKKMFDNYTLPALKGEPILPFLISARLRVADMAHAQIFDRNPYCDMDFLIARVLQLPRYEMHVINTELPIDRTKLKFNRNGNTINIVNTGSGAIIINSPRFLILHIDGNGQYAGKDNVTQHPLLPNNSLNIPMASQDDLLMVKVNSNEVKIIG